MNFCVDIIKQICKFLSNRNKNNYLSINKFYYKIKLSVTFDDPVLMSNYFLCDLIYYDSFTNLIMDTIIFLLETYDNDGDFYQQPSSYIIKKYAYLPKNIKKIRYDLNDRSGLILIMNSNTIIDLTFGENFDQPITNFIPSTVIYLTFMFGFNQSIAYAIPNGVRRLTFGYRFNQPIINAIPDNVRRLTFGNHFNQPILGAIPKNVKHLTFIGDFNQPIIGAIPKSVRYLTLDSYAFNQPIIGAIPFGLKNLTIRKRYKISQQMKSMIPIIKYV